MKALVFGVDSGFVPQPAPADDSVEARLLHGLANTPMALQEVADPELLGPDWVVLRSRLTGICGSDTKQVFMDMGDDASDFSMTAFISFPQVLGHEVIGDVVEVGPEAGGLHVGQRVALPVLALVRTEGDLAAVSRMRGRRLLPLLVVHRRPADTRHPHRELERRDRWLRRAPSRPPLDGDPDPRRRARRGRGPGGPVRGVAPRDHVQPAAAGRRALVWGAGALGTCAIAILRSLYPHVEVAAVVRHPAEQALARDLGVLVIDSALDDEQLVVELATWSGGRLHQPWAGLPIAHPGGIDVCYDTIASPKTIELALRVIAERGTIALSGVHAAGRFEWSPWYFKEVRIAGSNAFGMEEVDGVRKHAIEHYLDLARTGRVDVSAMLTHTFALDDWREAFETLAKQHDTGAIKAAFDFREQG